MRTFPFFFLRSAVVPDSHEATTQWHQNDGPGQERKMSAKSLSLLFLYPPRMCLLPLSFMCRGG